MRIALPLLAVLCLFGCQGGASADSSGLSALANKTPAEVQNKLGKAVAPPKYDDKEEGWLAKYDLPGFHACSATFRGTKEKHVLKGLWLNATAMTEKAAFDGLGLSSRTSTASKRRPPTKVRSRIYASSPRTPTTPWRSSCSDQMSTS